MIQKSDGGGFLIITEEPAGIFDVWLEHEIEVVTEVELLSPVWADTLD